MARHRYEERGGAGCVDWRIEFVDCLPKGPCNAVRSRRRMTKYMGGAFGVTHMMYTWRCGSVNASNREDETDDRERKWG